MNPILCSLSFLSGAAALSFETLFFSLAGLTLGNSVWAAAVVFAAFMAGLTLGSGAAAFAGPRMRAPLKIYAVLETAIAVAGAGLVVVFPYLNTALVPFWEVCRGHPFLLGFSRIFLALAFMSIPAAAMGATLPVLVKTLDRRGDGSYGHALGMLYGWNTAGAVAGVLLTEFVCISRFGIRGTGFLAAACNLIAAMGAVFLVSRIDISAPMSIPALSWLTKSIHNAGMTRTRITRLLGAAFVSGFLFLALEIVWFRFLLLFFNSVSTHFAVMLAVILAGLAGGGLFASRYCGRQPRRSLPLVQFICLNGILVVVLYSLFRYLPESPVITGLGEVWGLAGCALFLIFPVACVSGVMFTFLGQSLHEEMRDYAAATGMLAMVNTAGCMCGSFFGLLFLSRLGMERSFFLIALLHAATILLAAHESDSLRFGVRRPGGITVFLFIAACAVFPFGLMTSRFLPVPLRPFSDEGTRRVALKEGLGETLQYLQSDLLGQPYYHYLVTNSYPMAAATVVARRYMNFFVYWPLAVNPSIKNALLISYGCGNTAKALTDTRSIGHIDVVDVSRDILDMSTVVFPGPGEDPLRDSRVSVYVEDARFFLLTTRAKYDLITAEPPPPKNQGVVNLYTREYFQLVSDHLAPGGMVTYWLPVSHLTCREAQSVIQAFGGVFPDCSLWAALPFSWMLVGTKPPREGVSYADFRRQWDDPVTGPKMRGLGFLSPEQFCSLFIADGPRLSRWAGGARPLVDNYPRRLSSRLLNEFYLDPGYEEMMDPESCRKNFLASRNISSLWPAEIRRQTGGHFQARDMVFKVIGGYEGMTRLEKVYFCMRDPLLRPYLVWALDSDNDAQNIILRARARHIPVTVDTAGGDLAARAVLDGDYRLAAAYYRELSRKYWRQDDTYFAVRMYLHFIMGEEREAEDAGQEYVDLLESGKPERREKVKQLIWWLRKYCTDGLGSVGVQHGQR